MTLPPSRTDPTVPAAPVRDSGPGGVGVFPGILWAPVEAFARLASAPRWVGPFLVVLLLNGLGVWMALPTLLEVQAESAESMMDRLDLPEEQRAEAMAKLPDPADRSAGVLLRNLGSGVLGVAVLGFLGAGILHALVSAQGHSAKFRRTLAVFWAAAIASAVGAAVKYALMSAAGTMEVTLGPGALFPDLPFHSAPSILLDLLDVFSLWNLALLGIGLGVMYGISRGAAFTVAGIYWLVKAVFTAGSRFFVAWMMGGS